MLPVCTGDPATTASAAAAAAELAAEGLRVLAVARRPVRPAEVGARSADLERDLELLGVVALEDPPREGAAEAVAACRRAGIRLAMVTGDHPMTARAVAVEVGLLGPLGLVVEGHDLPADDAALGELLDTDGVVVARVTPEDKLRIARSLQGRGHVVAMTGDGVNDGPALREADIGVAMGRGAPTWPGRRRTSSCSTTTWRRWWPQWSSAGRRSPTSGASSPTTSRTTSVRW